MHDVISWTSNLQDTHHLAVVLLVRWLVGCLSFVLSVFSVLQAQGYHHATYSGESICEATYSGGSICESGLAVHESQDCRHRAITMLLIPVEVSVKVAYRPQTAATQLPPYYLFWWKYL